MVGRNWSGWAWIARMKFLVRRLVFIRLWTCRSSWLCRGVIEVLVMLWCVGHHERVYVYSTTWVLVGPVTPMVVVIVPSAFLITVVSMLPPAAVVLWPSDGSMC